MPGFPISIRTKKPPYEVADILRAHETEYRQQYRVTPQQAKVIGALTACRTAKLGGHVYECRECGAIEISYNACRDRHCPKCEKFRKAQWIEKQKVVILPIPYFHITFTTDHALNRLFAAHLHRSLAKGHSNTPLTSLKQDSNSQALYLIM
jgi:predicted Zn-ribbon and HTH transcriptional regulator